MRNRETEEKAFDWFVKSMEIMLPNIMPMVQYYDYIGTFIRKTIYIDEYTFPESEIVDTVQMFGGGVVLFSPPTPENSLLSSLF